MILGDKKAEFPFEALQDPAAQAAWERISGLVEDCILSLSFDWALEEIQKARRRTWTDPDFPLYLDYLEATVLRARQEPARARRAFLALAEKLSRRRPRPGRETLLCLYEAARLAPPPARKKELLRLARQIARGEWDDVPEKFLQFLFFDRILADLEALGDPEVQDILDTEIKPLERDREARRAFGISMTFLGKALVLSAMARDPLRPGEIRYMDMEGAEGPLILAVRALPAGGDGEKILAGVALNLTALAEGILAKGEEEAPSDPEALSIFLRTPRNQPVGPAPREETRDAPPVATLDLGPPLQGFRLLAVLRDPSAAKEREALDRWKLGIYLAALSLMAGTGAFFLARNVKRELELARLKADFVSRVTHDLKTPLSLIRLYAETLTMGRAEGVRDRRKCGAVILSECDRLNAMVDKILDFSRMDRGRSLYRPVRTRLGALLREALEAFRPRAESRGVELRWDVEGDPEAYLDEEGFRRCLFNLLDNAIKFGSPEVEVVLRGRGEEVELEVRDRGPGIPPDERERVFRPFYRGKGAGEKRGSGLGLSLVRHFVESHDGVIRILERAGGGTVFRISFPQAAKRRGTESPREVEP